MQRVGPAVTSHLEVSLKHMHVSFHICTSLSIYAPFFMHVRLFRTYARLFPCMHVSFGMPLTVSHEPACGHNSHSVEWQLTETFARDSCLAAHRDFDRKKPPFPGGFPIYYVPSSSTVRERTPLEECVPGSSRGVLTVLDNGI